MDFKIVEHYKSTKNIYFSYLKLDIISKHKLENVFGHLLISVCMSYIPTLVFDVKILDLTNKANIEKIKMNLENIPIIEKHDDINFYDDSYIYTYNKLLNETQDLKNNLKMIINIENTSDINCINITTDDKGVDFFYNNKKIKSIYDKPILLLSLYPLEKINCVCNIKLGIGFINYIFSPIVLRSNSTINDEGNIISLYLESRCNQNEIEILKRGIKILIDMLLNINIKMKNNISYVNDFTGIINISNENIILMKLISSHIKDNKNIIYAGLQIEHIFINKSNIKFETKNNYKIDKIIDEEINNIVFKYDSLLKFIEKH